MTEEYAFLSRMHETFLRVAYMLIHKTNQWGLPCWRSGLESACQSRGHGPWSGKIPHAAEQLSPCTTTTEPVF